jgi:hypothetical protein
MAAKSRSIPPDYIRKQQTKPTGINAGTIDKGRGSRGMEEREARA